MGQVIDIFRKKKKVFEPYVDSAYYYYLFQYPSFLKGELDREDLFLSGFVYHLDCFEMEKLISEYICNNSLQQKKLIDTIEHSAHYIESRKYYKVLDEIDNTSICLGFGRILLYLITLRTKYESFQKKEYILNVSQRTISSILHMIDMRILHHHDLIVNNIVAKKNQGITIEDVLSAYMVFEEKIADNYFELACISGSINQKIACDIILDIWYAGNEEERFFPTITIDKSRNLIISKFDVRKLRFNLLSFGFPNRVFTQKNMIIENQLSSKDEFINGIYLLFSYLSKKISREYVEIFYESISQVGIKKYSNYDYIIAQNIINDLLKLEKDKRLFFCVLYLMKDHVILKENKLYIALSEYFQNELEMGYETFKKFLYRKEKIYPYLKKYWNELKKIISNSIQQTPEFKELSNELKLI